MTGTGLTGAAGPPAGAGIAEDGAGIGKQITGDGEAYVYEGLALVDLSDLLDGTLIKGALIEGGGR